LISDFGFPPSDCDFGVTEETNANPLFRAAVVDCYNRSHKIKGAAHHTHQRFFLSSRHHHVSQSLLVSVSIIHDEGFFPFQWTHDCYYVFCCCFVGTTTSSFPHGEVIVLPLILSTLAVVSSLLTFGLLSFKGEDSKPTYGCIEYDLDNARKDQCFSLLLNDKTFWSDGVSDEWAPTIQTGAAFGILAVVMGIIAWAMLLSGTCLELKPRRLLIVRLLLLLATITGLLTLIAAAADVCELAKSGGTVNTGSKCDMKRFRLGYGGIAMMIGCGLHLLALVTTMGFKCASSAATAAVPPRQVEKQESAPDDAAENTA
jgi:hypothetical protein